MDFYKNLTAKKFVQQYRSSTNAILIDARTEKEYLAGNIEESTNIVYSNKKALLKLDKDKEYYLHCRVGGRSAVAAFILSQAGYEHVYNLNDNIANLMLELEQPQSV